MNFIKGILLDDKIKSFHGKAEVEWSGCGHGILEVSGLSPASSHNQTIFNQARNKKNSFRGLCKKRLGLTIRPYQTPPVPKAGYKKKCSRKMVSENFTYLDRVTQNIILSRSFMVDQLGPQCYQLTLQVCGVVDTCVEGQKYGSSSGSYSIYCLLVETWSMNSDKTN